MSTKASLTYEVEQATRHSPVVEASQKVCRHRLREGLPRQCASGPPGLPGNVKPPSLKMIAPPHALPVSLQEWWHASAKAAASQKWPDGQPAVTLQSACPSAAAAALWTGPLRLPALSGRCSCWPCPSSTGAAHRTCAWMLHQDNSSGNGQVSANLGQVWFHLVM